MPRPAKTPKTPKTKNPLAKSYKPPSTHPAPTTGEGPLHPAGKARDTASEFRTTNAQVRDKATGQKKTVRKNRPGIKALKEIRKYQKVRATRSPWP